MSETARAGKNSGVWVRKVVSEAKQAVRTDPGYFMSMLEAMAQQRAATAGFDASKKVS